MNDVQQVREMTEKERQNAANVIGKYISILRSRISAAKITLIIMFITITTVYLWRLIVVSAKQLSLKSFESIQQGFQIVFVHPDDSITLAQTAMKR